MPYQHIKFKIPLKYDRRRKLSDENKRTIWNLRNSHSQRQIARLFKVSRRLIQFILDPDKKKRNLENRANRGGSKRYYVKEIHTKTLRKHRRYKQKLFLQGKLGGRL